MRSTIRQVEPTFEGERSQLRVLELCFPQFHQSIELILGRRLAFQPPRISEIVKVSRGHLPTQ